MNPSGSRRKGRNFEAKVVCKLLSLWISKGERGDLLYRTPGSGSRATMRLKHGRPSDTEEYGDIRATHPKGWELTRRTVIECKHYKDFQLLCLVDRASNGELIGFWFKLCKLAAQVRRVPLLIFKRNFAKLCVMLPIALVSHKDWFWPQKPRIDSMGLQGEDFVIIRLADLTRFMTFDAFCAALDAYADSATVSHPAGLPCQAGTASIPG